MQLDWIRKYLFLRGEFPSAEYLKAGPTFKGSSVSNWMGSSTMSSSSAKHQKQNKFLFGLIWSHCIWSNLVLFSLI